MTMTIFTVLVKAQAGLKYGKTGLRIDENEDNLPNGHVENLVREMVKKSRNSMKQQLALNRNQ